MDTVKPARPGFTNITFTNEEDEEEVHELPSKFEVCSRCEGHGTHLHPDIGGHAYTLEEFNESFDDEEKEEYFKRGGMYDVPCEECKGARVAAVVDEERLTEEQKKAFALFQEQEEERARFERDWRREQEMESRMLGGW